MQAIPNTWETKLMKLGGLSALVLAVVVILTQALFASLSEANPRTETRQFLEDVAGNANVATTVIWLIAIAGLLTVPVFLGLFYALRRYAEDPMRVAALFGVLAGIFLALQAAPLAPIAGQILPAWDRATDEATRSSLVITASILQWVADAMGSMFGVTLSIAVAVSSWVMLKMRGRLGRVVGYIGIAGALFGLIAAFSIAWEDLQIDSLIHGILAILWLLGTGLIIWRQPATEAAS